MTIIKHGQWEVYKPTEVPKGIPAEIMWCRRVGDEVDWYDYQKTIDPSTVKCTVFESIIQAASYDASTLFPQGCLVIEITDVTSADPFKMLHGMKYDPETNTLV